MSMNYFVDGRTVSIVAPYKEEQVQGANGEYTRKSILFKIATNRNYKSTVDGKKEYQTDFFLVRASGAVAEYFNKYCGSLKKPDGKHLSRKVLIQGTVENYTKDRPFHLENVNINGALYDLDVTAKEERTVFIAERITFLDPQPDALKDGDGGVTVTATPSATVQAEPVQSAIPVAEAEPVQPVVPQAEAPQPMTAEEFLAGAVGAMSGADPF